MAVLNEMLTTESRSDVDFIVFRLCKKDTVDLLLFLVVSSQVFHHPSPLFCCTLLLPTRI